MDVTQNPIPGEGTKAKSSGDFAVGDTVVYNTHGLCEIVAIEAKTVSGQTQKFFILEKKKTIPTRKKQPSIWVPVDAAQAKGLRWPIDEDRMKEIYAVLGSQEYYFPLEEPWTIVVKRLEKAVAQEGHIGLAKVTSFCYVLVNRQIVPKQELLRYYENGMRIIAREISAITNQASAEIEQNLEKMMSSKLRPDN